MKNFRIQILFRLLIIIVFISLLIYFVFVEVNYLRVVYLAIGLIIAIVEFIYYVDRVNRDFTAFLLSLLQNDFTITFSENAKGKSFNKLYHSLNLITKKFKSISSEKEIQHVYLEALVEHIKVGMVSFDEKEKIHLMNAAFQQMVNRKQVAFLNNLKNVDEELVETMRNIKPGEKLLFKLANNQGLQQLSIHASEFKLNDVYYKLISFQNIKNELDNNELKAWQKLIRVLTHEIMNSVTPITSLSESLGQLVSDDIPKENVGKIKQGLDAIKQRSHGLQNFTTTYRKLTQLPTPNFEKFNLQKAIDNVIILMQDELKDITINIEVGSDITILGDVNLYQQVFINLLKNAIYATQNQKLRVINIVAEQKEQIVISISDNGCGIPQDKIDNIFVPFFTTKQNGTGIGLALSRQIMQIHNGTIQADSIPEQGTTFTLTQ